MSRVMEGDLQADGGEKQGEEDENTDVYRDIGKELDVEWEQKHERKLNQAEENRISNNGRKELDFILRQHWDTVRVRHNVDEAALVRPLELRINQQRTPSENKNKEIYTRKTPVFAQLCDTT